MIQLDVVKYLIPMFINYLKSHIQGVAKPWDWDPFNIFLKNPNPTATTTPPPPWTDLFIHVSLLLILLASASIDVTVARLRGPPLYLLILGSLFLPQALFWYACASLLAACLIMTILKPRRAGLHANSTTTAAATTDDQSHSSHVPQIAIDISPQHHDAVEADDEVILLV